MRSRRKCDLKRNKRIRVAWEDRNGCVTSLEMTHTNDKHAKNAICEEKERVESNGIFLLIAFSGWTPISPFGFVSRIHVVRHHHTHCHSVSLFLRCHSS